MKYLNKISATSVIIFFVVLILAGTYLLYPKGEKSEFFYLILMTVVISGADEQMVKALFRKISHRSAGKKSLLSDKENDDR
ncbi:MAG: hypothetical protein HYU71_13935 [Bacteroidetes bacterium]|nr:hypothetical protein [Bacteroidota bacterium]